MCLKWVSTFSSTLDDDPDDGADIDVDDVDDANTDDDADVEMGDGDVDVDDGGDVVACFVDFALIIKGVRKRTQIIMNE